MFGLNRSSSCDAELREGGCSDEYPSDLAIRWVSDS
jgi:hypothetical protein